jgi:hypothetical protein
MTPTTAAAPAYTAGVVETAGPLELEPESFRAKFPQRPLVIRHHLADHPLFAVPRLLELAKALPESCVEYNEGNIPVNMGNRPSPRTGLSAEDTIRRIREAHSWMVLKYVENDAAYRGLLNHCLDQVRELSEPLVPGMCAREGFIFLTSPHAVTPFHLDPEHNFLLQIRGRKLVTMFDPADACVITEADIERGLFGENRNLVYRSECQERGQTFELTPGTGLHFPVAAPHWVKNTEEVSISFSITFRSQISERYGVIRRFNAGLRQRGIPPSPVGRSFLRDSAKYHVYRALRRTRRLFQVSYPPRPQSRSRGIQDRGDTESA